ncbi:aldo/keto reductase [Aureimonas frigidaquae]|uniref:Aldo/keto reductase n=1 Tax=Aureimonas frigidaquae TaxID=424757 RepID=A0A0P0Z0G1_9HYPH|nr:aldo/keto reductase [Aureimonas frigidaquae]BAT27349.1 aldo/keto reductase [Aureimonas frigidaquae]
MKVSDRRALARTGLELTVLGIGGAQLGGLYRTMTDEAAAEIVDAAYAAGIRYFDTAPFYGFTRSERRVGHALEPRPRDSYVLSTKVGRLMRPDDSVGAFEQGYAEPMPFRPHYDYSYDGILRSYEDSLQRLGLTRVDMLFVHDIGTATHGADNAGYFEQLTRGGGFRALEELRSAGEVRGVGLGVNEHQIVEAAMDEMDLDCTMLAGRYTLLEQDSLRMLDRAAKAGHAIVAAAPFNSGLLVGNRKFNYEDAPQAVIDRADRLAAVAREFDVPLPAAAIQFPLAHPAVVAVNTGAHRVDQVRTSVDWFETPIPAAFWTALKERGLIGDDVPVPAS